MTRIGRVRTLALLMFSTAFSIVVLMLASTVPVNASACCNTCESIDLTCSAACEDQCGGNPSCLSTCNDECISASDACWWTCTNCSPEGCNYIWWWVETPSGHLIDSWCA
jgi:hypothetical protein